MKYLIILQTLLVLYSFQFLIGSIQASSTVITSLFVYIVCHVLIAQLLCFFICTRQQQLPMNTFFKLKFI